jgi:hypothetical protein
MGSPLAALRRRPRFSFQVASALDEMAQDAGSPPSGERFAAPDEPGHDLPDEPPRGWCKVDRREFGGVQ